MSSRIALITGLGYLLGSIPFGYLMVRIFHGADIRKSGSGNIGATNVARTSPKLGLITLVLDAAKGTAAVMIAFAVAPGNIEIAFMAAVAALCGHVFPIWLRFRGGKGVATGLGAFALLMPKSVLAALVIFILLVASLGYVALGSVVAAATLPFLALALGEARIQSEGWLLAGASVLIILKHGPNLRRMISGKEPKFSLKRRSGPAEPR
jgi:glycerol-3-phosphate acyltransferase PlsY